LCVVLQAAQVQQQEVKMGASASLFQKLAQDHPELAETYRREFAEMFATEMKSLKDADVSEEQLRIEFDEKLRLKAMNIISEISNDSHRNTTEGFEDNRFIADIQQLHNRAKAKRSLNYLVCVDGSEAADTAFKSALTITRKIDRLCIFYAFEPEDVPYMIRKFHPDQVRSKYESLAIATLDKDSFEFQAIEKQGRSVIEAVRDYCDRSDDHLRPDFVVLGRTGGTAKASDVTGQTAERSSKSCHCYACHIRMQEMLEEQHKMHPAAHHNKTLSPRLKATGISSLGCTAETGLRSLHLPVIVMKEAVSSRRAHSFVLAVDGSLHSQLGLDILLRLVRPSDSLRVIHVTSRDADRAEVERIKSYYEQELSHAAPADSAFVLLHSLGNVVVNVICSFVNDMNADFVALAPRAQREFEITDLTEGVIVNAKANIILCKN
jgi:nucleotide-binding universal stress UspA family protein